MNQKTLDKPTERKWRRGWKKVGRIFFWLFGFGLSVAGGVSIILYVNLMAAGLTFVEYVKFLAKKGNCYLFVLGLIIISLSIYYPQPKKKK